MENPEDSFDHFLEALDLAGTVSVDRQCSLSTIVKLDRGTYADQVDPVKHCTKATRVLESATDPEIRRLFQEIADLFCD